MASTLGKMVRAVLAGLALLSPARAAQEEAIALYAAGAYDEAVAIAVRGGGADDLAFAARALNAAGYFETDRKAARRTAKRALEFAEAAIEIDPDNPEAHLQAAISLAVRGANMSPAKAFFKRLASRSRNHIDAALEIDAENPWALSTSGAWRLEVARRGGGVIYGADPEDGYREFLAARRGAPDNVAIAYECALRLLASERPEWRAEALEALEAALAGEAETKFEADLQSRAGELKLAILEGRAAERAFIDAQP